MLAKGLSTHSGPSSGRFSGRFSGCCSLGCGASGTGLDGPLDQTSGNPEGALYVDFLLLVGVRDGPGHGEGARAGAGSSSSDPSRESGSRVIQYPAISLAVR